MKASRIQHSENGFAAVTVMVISLLGGLIVFDTVQENVNQERMAGNYSKELNARLQAENGMAASYNALSANSALSGDDMMTQLNDTQNDTGAYHYELSYTDISDSIETTTGDSNDSNDSNDTLIETIVNPLLGISDTVNVNDGSTADSSNDIVMDSEGAHFDGYYKIRGTMSSASSGGSSIYTGPITTCDSTSIAGSARIDSYNSEQGTYSETIAANGDVTILNNDSSLIVSNQGNINGDVSVNGNINLASDGSITGNAFAYDGNLNTTDNEGNVTAYSYDGEQNKSTLGNITSSNGWNTTIDGIISATGDVNYQSNNPTTSPDSITANGAVTASVLIPVNEGTVNNIVPQECDVLNLSGQFDNLADGSTGVNTLQNSSLATSLPFSDPTGVKNITLSGDSSYATPIDGISFFGNDTSVYVLDLNTIVNNQMTLTIESDITIYLPNDTHIQGNIDITEGSSLTIITKSEFKLKGTITGLNSDGSDSDSVVSSNGNSYLNLYSYYDSVIDGGDGVIFNNGASGTISVYAPKADIDISGYGTVYGSLRGKSLDLRNSGGLHYDEALANSNTGSIGSGEASIEIKRWF